MAFNLNTSQKPDYTLNENLTHEAIQMYGIQCKWLFSERINEDFVFRDFSHFKVNSDFKDVTLMPQETMSWEGDVAYNNFGFYNQWTQQLFISKSSMLDLYPDFLDKGNSARAKVVNSLLITPSSTILEVTHVESFTEGVNNVWGYNDNPSTYKLTVKIYSNNLSDEGVTEVKDTIDLKEGPEDENGVAEIFDHEQEIDTSDIDNFFNELSKVKEEQDTEGDKISSNTNPFGTLG